MALPMLESRLQIRRRNGHLRFRMAEQELPGCLRDLSIQTMKLRYKNALQPFAPGQILA